MGKEFLCTAGTTIRVYNVSECLGAALALKPGQASKADASDQSNPVFPSATTGWSDPPSMLLLPVATPTPTAVAQANCLPRPSHMPVHMTIPNPFVAWYFIYQISFLVIRATLPTLVSVRALGCRDDGGWHGLQVRPRPRPHIQNSSQIQPLLTKYILCMPQAWLQRYNYKQPQFFYWMRRKLKN